MSNKTSNAQSRANKTYRQRMQDKGFVWKSAFVPVEKIDEHNEIIRKWRDEHKAG